MAIVRKCCTFRFGTSDAECRRASQPVPKCLLAPPALEPRERYKGRGASRYHLRRNTTPDRQERPDVPQVGEISDVRLFAIAESRCHWLDDPHMPQLRSARFPENIRHSRRRGARKAV
jgi:hypothetical protein